MADDSFASGLGGGGAPRPRPLPAGAAAEGGGADVGGGAASAASSGSRSASVDHRDNAIVRAPTSAALGMVTRSRSAGVSPDATLPPTSASTSAPTAATVVR